VSIKERFKKVLPTATLNLLGSARQKIARARLAALPVLTESSLTDILAGELRLAAGDTVFVHSSMDQLNLGFPFYRVLSLIREVIGGEGTILFPTYPQLSSYEFLARGEIFDVRKTPSYTGILTEFARRQRGALRSLHPTKSVCALGSNSLASPLPVPLRPPEPLPKDHRVRWKDRRPRSFYEEPIFRSHCRRRVESGVPRPPVSSRAFCRAVHQL
jgi:Aminoglycoside 3-N-acetyltransferase